MMFPTKKIRSGLTPSRRRFASASGDVVKQNLDRTSVTIRLISSGIARSKLLSPASTCATGTSAFAPTREQASVEFTSPTTTMRSGRSRATTPSNAIMIFAVCSAWEPEPTPRWMSGSGSSRSSKNTRDMLSS